MDSLGANEVKLRNGDAESHDVNEEVAHELAADHTVLTTRKNVLFEPEHAAQQDTQYLPGTILYTAEPEQPYKVFVLLLGQVKGVGFYYHCGGLGIPAYSVYLCTRCLVDELLPAD